MIIEMLLLFTLGLLLAVVSFLWMRRDEFAIAPILLFILSIAFALVAPAGYYQSTVGVDISTNADLYCKQQGYDTFDSWAGRGLFPTEYAYVKCKFYDNRRVVDANVDVGGFD